MMEFILKLRKLEVRLIKETLMQRELQKMAQAILDQMNFLMTQSQSMSTWEQKNIQTLLNTFTEEIGSQQDQNFLQGNNVDPKKN